MMEKRKMISSLSRIGASISGVHVLVKDLSPLEGVGCSIYYSDKKEAEIYLSFDYPLQLEEKKTMCVLMGVFIHEILHVLHTDFDLLNEFISKYPKNEEKDRREIHNIIEDPAIEYMGSPMIPKYMEKCLRMSIRYFFEHGMPIDSPDITDPYMQVTAAMIHFGDMGCIKGNFTFPEAKDAFIRICPIMNQAIEEVDFTKRFHLTQKVFEELRPLWEEHQRDTLANSKMDKMLSSLGKSRKNGSGSSISNDNKTQNGNTEISQKRRGFVDKISKVSNENPDSTNILDELNKALQSLEGKNESPSDTDQLFSSLQDIPDEECLSDQEMSQLSDLIEQIYKSEQKKVEAIRKKEDMSLPVESSFYKDVDYEIQDILYGDSNTYTQYVSELFKYITGLRSSFRKIFQEPHSRKEYRTSGRVNAARVCGKKMTARVFERKIKSHDKADLAILILLDESGSMSRHISMVKKTCILLLEALSGFPVSVKVIGFTSTDSKVIYHNFGNRVWKNTKNLRECITEAKAFGGTFLGHSLRYSLQLLKKQKERNKLLICVTDGLPSPYGTMTYPEALEDCRNAIRELKRNTEVIGVGVYETKTQEDDFHFIFQNGTVTMKDLSDLRKKLPELVKKKISNFS